MPQQGRLTEWNDERGFGFVTPLDGGPKLFAHVSEFPRQQRRPYVNDLVIFSEERDERGRLRATRIAYLAPTHARNDRHNDRPVVPAVFVIPFLILMAVLAALQLAPVELVGLYAVASVASFCMYGLDKYAAEHGKWRTSEASLHMIALLGGWPGALVAQQVFRHKTIKRPFRLVFGATVLGNCALLLLFLAGWSILPG